MKKTVFINGIIYTVNEQQQWAEAILVEGNNITKVGTNNEIAKLIDQETSVIDLENKLVLPGFIDAHTHIFLGEIMNMGLQFGMVGSKEDLIIQIKEYVNKNVDLEFVFGIGFSTSIFGDCLPTAKDLDDIAINIPIVLLDEGCHSMWVNSKALEIAGICKHTKDPIPGSDFYQRDQYGNPTGWIVESQSMRPISRKLGLLETLLRNDLSSMFDRLSSYGITSVFNASEFFFSANSLDTIDYMEQKARNGEAKIRFFTSYSYNNHESDQDPVEILNNLNIRYQSDYVRMDTLKIWLDGTVEARNAALSEPYCGSTETGQIFYSLEELQRVIDKVKEYGLSLHLHAIGDKTIDTALTLCQNANLKYSHTKGTQTIAHNEVFNQYTVSRFARTEIIANTTPIWHVASEGSKRNLGMERYRNMYKFNSLIKNEVTVSFGSDYPTGLGELAMNVFYNIQTGHTRTFPNDLESLPDADEMLSIHDLIKGYTLNAAIQLSMQDKIGSIEEGKFADFIVLQENLFEQDPNQIHTNQVIKTIFDGKVVYEK
ncbi:MAG: amidohydrolase [Brevinemataceae bacterium]